ncbi:Dyp-type peroxidase [Sedimenticola thiotaurini]|uniref:Peroxidase n=1 Tax=Sedimenticola thiotaurini TaxID=1543721 RepID=A0A0F7K1Z2_9GAMM|nr:peroxidase [Sedimenticola thiotaurini]AKH21932.1 peroxidase [Sedimenticola thiotaurini]
MSRPAEPDYQDIQALARFGHGSLPEALFLLLDITDPAKAGAWLEAAPVSSAEWLDTPPETALQIAVSAGGLRALQLDEALIEGFSEEFIVGMAADHNRSRRLGDVTDNAPQHWAWGGDPERVPGLLVLLYAKSGRLAAWREQIQTPLFNQAFNTVSELTTVDSENIEPFGFSDGISQPTIDWEGRQTSDLHRRDAYSNLLCLGELLLGYRNEYGQYARRPLLDTDGDPDAARLPAAEEQPNLQDLGRNGSYLVMRQLHQDVAGFWQFLDQQANGDPQQREQLASRMVGRQRDGTPLVESDPPSDPNQFDFHADPHGQRCPIGAHIRRANPRTGDFPPGVTGLLSRLVRIFGFGRRHPGDDLIASTRFHRLLRRGRVYGEQLSPQQALQADATQAPRGLHFICLMADISRQFEFVQNAWSMGPKFGGVQNESDPLLGNRQPLANDQPTDHFSQPTAQGPAQGIHALPQFVTVRGGGYFFMPGIRALRYLAHCATSRDKSKS